MLLGLNSDDRLVELPPEDFLTHGVILGRTGSGKTGLTITLLEEASASGASAIVFDPKGDLTNLAIAPTSAPDLQRWVASEAEAQKELRSRKAGLAKFGLSLESVANWRHKVGVDIYAPGKTYGGGLPVNVFPTFEVPSDSMMPLRDRANREVGSVLEAIGEGNDPFSPAQVYLAEAVTASWTNGKSLPVDVWPRVLNEPTPNLQSFGGMPVKDFYPKKYRTKLARKLIGFRHQADRWLNGDPFDFDRLTKRPRIAVFTMRHLSEEDRHFFTGLMMNRIVDYMFSTDASNRLKLLVVLDEARGYLPPYPFNPPTKDPICTILAQGRAQGIGMVIGTQNPMDLDYKALSNVGTWFVGRLRERDCNRDLGAELKGRDVDLETIQDLPNRRFLLLDKRGGHNLLTVRWTYSYLKGPLGAQELESLTAPIADKGSRLERMKRNKRFWGEILGW